MARIMHLEPDPHVRAKFAEAIRCEGHEVVGFDSVKRAQNGGEFDLYVVNGEIGRKVDSNAFAMRVLTEGKKVLLTGNVRKFTKLPFLSLHDLSSRPLQVSLVVRTVLEQ